MTTDDDDGIMDDTFDDTAEDSGADGDSVDEDHDGDVDVDDEDGDKDTNGKPAKKKKKGWFNKLGMKSKIALSVGGVLFLLVLVGLQPLKGSIRYGICKTFIELQIPYPPTLQVNSIEEYESAVRVYFSHIDPFGSSRLNMVECTFRPDPRTTLALQSVRMNRDDVPQAEVDLFNVSIPYIMQNPPDLRLPRYRGSSLSDLKIDYN